MIFEEILLLTAKLGLALLLLLFFLRWFIVIPFLWFKYDKQITDLKKELDEFRKNERKNGGVTQGVLDGRINMKTREVNEKLDILETHRRLFLDRVNLFLSIISIQNK